MPLRTPLLLALVTTLAACGSTPGGSGGGAAEPAQGGVSSTGAPAITTWPIKTRENVDLWLHGFAMLQDDTTTVPYFRRGYRDAMIVRRNQANATSALDVNRDRLRARFNVNRDLGNAQFVALYFGTWNDMKELTRIFLEAEGDPRRAGNNAQLGGYLAIMAGYFPTNADREWLRLFVSALDDESTRFYHSYWVQAQRERTGALAVTDSLWNKVYQPRLRRFLNNTQQADGQVLLSLPLNGEGRSLSGGKRQNTVAVLHPDREDQALDAIYVIAHELVGSLANTTVMDNTSPNEQRSGMAAGYASNMLVRGGLQLLEKTVPELADGYARFYLRAANRTSTGSNPRQALAAAFPVPENLVTAFQRQLDVVLGGI